jgi:sporulation protein YlmC with PRC-barrel domain
MDMLIEATNLIDKTVITDKGMELGVVSNVIIDIEKFTIHELLVDNTNEEIVENAIPVGVPFRWVQSISNHIVLRHFPGKVRVKPTEREPSGIRKMRVVKKKWGDDGVNRTEWR